MFHIEVFKKWYQENNVFECSALGATGLYAGAVGREVVLPQNCLTFEAEGAARLAANRIAANQVSAYGVAKMTKSLPEDPESLIDIREKRFTVLSPALESKDQVTVMADIAQAENWESQPSVLGLDIGSTGAKAVLTSIETGEPLMDVYDSTSWGKRFFFRASPHPVIVWHGPWLRSPGVISWCRPIRVPWVPGALGCAL